ncbi:MAG: hypothetical protein ACXVB9_02180 [Bdellovibrionota bacterium]
MKSFPFFFTLILTLVSLPVFADGFPPRPPRPTFGQGDFLRPGDIVWTESGMQAQVQAVFPNGQVSVLFNNVAFNYARSQLAVRGCQRGLCTGTPVVTTSGMNAVVNGFFQNGDVSVVFNTVNFRYPAAELASQRPPFRPDPPQFGEIRLGDAVWTESGMQGQVSGLFPDGRVNVVYNSVNFQYQRAQLATRGCLGNLCSGDAVVNRSGMRAVVNGFFNDNQRVSVVFNSVNFVYNYNDLAKTF